MGKLRKIEDAREAKECLAAVEEAGESIGAWARPRGIDGRSLRAWHLNFARRLGAPGRREAVSRGAAQEPPASLVELVPCAARPPARYVVAVGSASVEFGDDFREDTLRRVLEALRSC